MMDLLMKLNERLIDTEQALEKALKIMVPNPGST